jgi:DNA-binding XRE family transcriptional regulator
MHPYNPGMPRRLERPRPKQAARLVALRKAAGLSQAELAKLARVSPKTIGFWETSPIPPRSDVLPRLAKALGVRVEDILFVYTILRYCGACCARQGGTGAGRRCMLLRFAG